MCMRVDSTNAQEQQMYFTVTDKVSYFIVYDHKTNILILILPQVLQYFMIFLISLNHIKFVIIPFSKFITLQDTHLRDSDH